MDGSAGTEEADRKQCNCVQLLEQQEMRLPAVDCVCSKSSKRYSFENIQLD